MASFQVRNVNDVAALIIFVLVGTIISGLCESLHRARRRIVADERREAEEARREVDDRFRGTFENAAVGIIHGDVQGRFLRVNQKYCDIVGYSRQELLEMSMKDVTHPDDLVFTVEKFEQLIHGEIASYSEEKRDICKDGSLIWIHISVSLQRDRQGAPLHTIGILQDISQRKRLEAELRESERRWRGLTEALPQLVWSAAPDGTCDYFSKQWTAHTGVSESNLLGWQWLQTLHPEDRERTRRFWLDSVAGLGPYDVEYRVRRSDGVYRWFKTRGTPIRDDVGEIFKWFGSCTDITDLRQTEEELRSAKEAAESANRAKDEFLANVSHEIRTPMNAIIGMTDLVLDTPMTDDQRQCLRTVKSAADNLLGLINDLLDFSKIEAGKLELESADFALRTVLSDTLRTLADRAHTKGLELVSHVLHDVPDALIGDAGRLRQVLLNLVGNAVKFTEVGEVVVRVELAGSEDRGQKSEVGEEVTTVLTSGLCLLTSDKVHLRFTVIDTGIGIPLDKQEKIFRAFEQEDTSTTRRYGGTGLGLSIAALLVDLMGGAIGVKSEQGRGSIFTFTAKFARQSSTQPVAVRSPVVLDNLQVLIVDDNSTNRHILEEWLRIWQMEPLAVGDGVTAMDTLWDAAARGLPYPLVLLDARMPDTDGLVLAAKIRRRAELSVTRIILLTSGDFSHDLSRLRELRIDAHMLKPVQQEELLETIYRVLSNDEGRKGKDEGGKARDEGGRMRDEKAESLASVSSFPLSILVAEDNDFNAQLLEQLLVRRGHRVQLAGDGQKALAMLGLGGRRSEGRGQRSEGRGQKPEVRDQILEGTEDSSLLGSDLRPLNSGLRPLTSAFDLLLLDVHMPELDGFQVIDAIREHERSVGGDICPVIAFLTGRSRKEDRERCLAAGMDEFLAKPIQAPDLWVTIDKVMSKDEGGRIRDEKEKTPQSDSSFFPHPSSLLDARVLLAACGGDAVILEKICQAFRTGLPSHLKAVQDASRDGDTVRLRDAAHKLCGMVAAFSTVAGVVASKIEDHADLGQIDQARPLVKQLESMADKLVRLTTGLSLETLQQQRENPTRA